MSPEDRKVYNKEYYQKNKETILEKASAKIQCQFCFRTVAQNNLMKHYSLPICERRQKEIKLIQIRNSI